MDIFSEVYLDKLAVHVHYDSMVESRTLLGPEYIQFLFKKKISE